MICYHIEMLMLALTLVAAAPSDSEAVRRAIAAKCEVDAARLTIEPWADPEQDMIIVTGDGGLSDAQLDCIGAVGTEGGVLLGFDNAVLSKRYVIVTSRSNLAAMHVLDRLPKYDPARHSLHGFARQLERYCRARPGSFLVVKNNNIAMRPAVWDRPEGSDGDAVICLVNALGASGFDAFGAIPPVPQPVFETHVPVLQTPDVTTPSS